MAKAKKTRKKRTWEVLSETSRLEAEQQFTALARHDYRDKAFENNQRTVDDIAKYFVESDKGTRSILPKEKRRYVIYLRKSTDSEDKQVRSVEDQRAECLALARRQNISIRDIDILEESASAKTSGNREIFTEMLQGFRESKYHGLISWSPDRISRNMKEAGEVIEMIDLEDIQDLQFCTYSFENTPNGKMMLGILFATSKQYSDKLSVDVSRGITGNIRDGKYTGVTKKGYYVDVGTGYFIPDGYNWDVLRAAVDMRLYEGKNNVEVADFLSNTRLSVRKNQETDYRLVKVDKQMVGDIFADPFYMGLYKYGKNQANLIDLYEFVPLVTPDEYIMLNREVASDFGKEDAKVKRSKRLDYGLLRNKVICDYCDTEMQFQHTKIQRGKNADKWLISFYCRNTACLRHDTAEQKRQGIKLSKSIRGSFVMAGIEWYLRHCTKESQEAYRLYIDRLEVKLAQERQIAKRKILDAKQDKRKDEIQYARYQNFQVEKPEDYERHHHGKLEHHLRRVELAQESIDNNTARLKELTTALPTEKEFYELTNSYLLRLLEEDDIMVLDTICNELVLNLRAGDNSTPVINLNPPYNMLVDLSEISSGRG